MKHLLHVLLLGTVLVATSARADHADHGTAADQVHAGDLMILGAFSRATLPRAPVGGAYFTVMNHGAREDRLLSVTAPVGKEVQIHTMEVKDGVMTMRPLPDGLPIPAGGTVTLEPSGTHLMLMGLTEKLVEANMIAQGIAPEAAARLAAALETAEAALPTGQVARFALFDGVLQDLHPAAEIAEAIWIDPAAPPAMPLAPLTRDQILPLAARLAQG